MPIVDAFYQRKKLEVMQDTWGHLAPRPGMVYPAKMLFTQSETGDLVVIRSDFGNLPGSPWLLEDMNNFVYRHASEPGEIYRFAGTYCKQHDGECCFVGDITKLNIEL